MADTASYVVYYDKGPGSVMHIPFTYRSQSHVKVYADDVLVSSSKYTFTTANLITALGSFPSAGQVRIMRETPLDSLDTIEGSGKQSWVASNTNFDKLKRKVEEQRDAISSSLQFTPGQTIAEDRVPVMGPFGRMVEGPSVSEISSAQSYAESAAESVTALNALSEIVSDFLPGLEGLPAAVGGVTEVVGDGSTDNKPIYENTITSLKALGGGFAVLAPSIAGYKISHNQGAAADGTTFKIEKASMEFYDAGHNNKLRRQSRSPFKAFIRNANGEGSSGYQGFSFNGDVLDSTYKNMVSVITPDNTVFSFNGFRGNEGTPGTNPLIPGHLMSWFENDDNLVWTLEIDVQNEAGIPIEASDNFGVGIMLNTGSTYSPGDAIKVKRVNGAGTGPGYLRGVVLEGVRDVGLRVMAMDTTTYPGLSPAAPGTISVIQASKSSDAFIRFIMDETGRMKWSSGSADSDLTISRVAAGTLKVSSAIDGVERTVGIQLDSISNEPGEITKISSWGLNTSGTGVEYGALLNVIFDPTAGNEECAYQLWTRVAGETELRLTVRDGLVVGAAGGGDQGHGTINLAGDLYQNAIAYTGPDYVFELAFKGRIKEFAENPGAEDYKFLPLEDVEQYAKENLQLPRVASRRGVFERSNVVLEKIEELFLHLFDLNTRLKRLENV